MTVYKNQHDKQTNLEWNIKGEYRKLVASCCFLALHSCWRAMKMIITQPDTLTVPRSERLGFLFSL